MTPQVKVFTLPFDEALPGFDDGVVADFVGSHAVTEIRHEFFYHVGNPWLMVLIHWRRPVGEVVASRRSGRPPSSSSDDQGLAALPAAARERFERLRKWRGERARLDGVSHFVILTNRQLTALAEQAPRSLAALLAVDGIGQGKLTRYGSDLLAVLHPTRPEPATVASESTNAERGTAEKNDEPPKEAELTQPPKVEAGSDGG